MRVTLYLPDELRQRAKEADLNLSRILRDGVERELSGDPTPPSVHVDRVGGLIQVRVALPAEQLRRLAE